MATRKVGETRTGSTDTASSTVSPSAATKAQLAARYRDRLFGSGMSDNGPTFAQFSGEASPEVTAPSDGSSGHASRGLIRPMSKDKTGNDGNISENYPHSFAKETIPEVVSAVKKKFEDDLGATVKGPKDGGEGSYEVDIPRQGLWPLTVPGGKLTFVITSSNVSVFGSCGKTVWNGIEEEIKKKLG